ncbi:MULTISPECIES: site-specific integrase [Parabacteroides]|uniref:site-specific integrase n=1 Tax=Parabacteroides leei TaxID=2939491 RepID=UPI001E2D6C28|nr:site-specific integrase [Parabacteroides goldsteinii]
MKIKTRSTFAVLFYIDKSKAKKKSKGLCTITGRITIDTEIARFSTKMDVNPEIWDAQTGRVIGKGKEVTKINRTLDNLEQEIQSHYDRLVLEDGYVTAEAVKNALNGIGKKATGLLELFREHNEEFKFRVGVNRVKDTYEHYLHSYRILENFLWVRFQIKDIALNQLTHSFIDAYDFHLRVDKRMNSNTVLNHTIPLRKMIRRAISQDIIKRDPFVNYVAEKPLKQRRHLTMDEFQKLLTTPITEKHLERCRDMFLFACFSGMAYADVCNLSEKHITQDDNGVMWIRIERQKTKSECRIRLLNVPIQIMEKYKHERTDDKIFKLKTLKTIDENLKIIAQKCGIESRLCYHMGRHTYATQVCISQGVPIETLCKMMGHRSVQTTQIYAKITNQKVNEDMKILSSRIENRYELPKDDMPEKFARNQYYK